MINCQGSASPVYSHAVLGSNPSVSAAAQERVGVGAWEEGRTAVAPSPGTLPRTAADFGPGRRSGRRVLGGAPGTLCDRAPGPREPRLALPHFLLPGPLPALLEPVADEFPRNKAASLTGLSPEQRKRRAQSLGPRLRPGPDRSGPS